MFSIFMETMVRPLKKKLPILWNLLTIPGNLATMSHFGVICGGSKINSIGLERIQRLSSNIPKKD
jgi:hypothetical protein